MPGFKPQEMCDLLAVGKPRFRYWREHLDPWPDRARFTASDALSYRVIKFLVLYQELRAETLADCGIDQLFEWSRGISLEEARRTMLVMDTRQKTLTLLPPGERPGGYGFGVHHVPLAEVVDEHEHSLLNFGVAV